MARVLILYSTTDGHTLEICERLKQVVEGRGNCVDLVSIDDAGAIDLNPFDKIVIGASIRYGRHDRQVYRFVEDKRQDLDRKPNVFFSVNVVARKPEKSRPETNPYLQKFLGQISWRPRKLAVFAGKIDYPRYGWFDRNVIRMIMWMTKGPTDPQAVIDFTDWSQVERFGQEVCDM
ncbi:MAG: menaquinone-dependent protoporphyrinogen IX dehydrogenase [Gammaproteobacteria bacterium]|jgi:menaquinone-dependent protoporphyrinogen oxidase